MFRTLTMIALGLTLAAPAAAQSLRVEGRVTVAASPGGFTVDGGGGHGARGMWCAASRYATRILGASDTTRIYVAPGSTNSRGVFTTNARGLTSSSVLSVGSSVRTPGANLSVGHAQAFCADFRISNGR